jgi:hypothetical protein
MRVGPRRLPLIALGVLGALIALILAGTYIYRERGVLVDERGSGQAVRRRKFSRRTATGISGGLMSARRPWAANTQRLASVTSAWPSSSCRIVRSRLGTRALPSMGHRILAWSTTTWAERSTS